MAEHAIEEPYEAIENAQDPFLDADEPQIHHIAANDLNLLRPRGHANQQGPNPLAAVRLRQGTPLGEQIEEDDESTSASDSTNTEDINDNSSDDGGSDDDGADGSGTGRGLAGQPEDPNGSRNGRRQQERDRGGINPGPEHGANHSAAQERVHNMPPSLEYISAYGSPNLTLDTSRYRVSSLGSGNTITVNRTSSRKATNPTLTTPQNPHGSPFSSPTSGPFSLPPLLPQRLPPLSSPQSWTPSSPPPIPLSSKPSPTPPIRSSDKYSVSKSPYTTPATEESEESVPSLSSHPSPLPPKSGESYSPAPTSITSQKPKRSLSNLFRKGRKSKSELESDRSAPVSSPHRGSRSWSIPELESDRVLSWGVRKTMRGISELPSDDSQLFGTQVKGSDISELSSEPLHVTLGPIPETINIGTELSTESDFGWERCGKEKRIQPIPSRVFEMSAPIHNPPASTAILPTGTNAPKSTEDVEKESLVRRLLTLQSFDGSFLFTEGHLESSFGKEFCTATHDLELNLHQISINQAEKYKIAVAIAIIVELEERYQSCRDLWLLIVEKARHFVDIWLGGFEKENLFEFVKDLLKSDNRDQVMDPIRDREARRLETTTAAAAAPARPSWLGQKIQMQNQMSVKEEGGSSLARRRRRRHIWGSKNSAPAETQLGTGKGEQSSGEGKSAALVEAGVERSSFDW